MAITNAEVAKLADLAKIDMSEEELEAMAGQLAVILDAVAAVSEVDTTLVQPTSHALHLSNVFRPDQVSDSLPLDQVLGMAPEVEGSRIRVPRILGEA